MTMIDDFEVVEITADRLWQHVEANVYQRPDGKFHEFPPGARHVILVKQPNRAIELLRAAALGEP